MCMGFFGAMVVHKWKIPPVLLNNFQFYSHRTYNSQSTNYFHNQLSQSFLTGKCNGKNVTILVKLILNILQV